MITYDYCPEKNKKFLDMGGISFEIVISILENEGPIDIIDHHNMVIYGHQKIFVIKFNNYIYMVPFVIKENKIFLKTIISHRKLTKRYLNKGN